MFLRRKKKGNRFHIFGIKNKFIGYGILWCSSGSRVDRNGLGNEKQHDQTKFSYLLPEFSVGDK
jgi:hypothetical protein